VARRMQRHAVLDPGAIGRLMEEAAQLTRGYWLAGSPALAAKKEPAFLHGNPRVVTRWTHLPPFAQQAEHSGDSITLRSLRPLDCSMRMIFCALSMCLTLSRTTTPARRPQP
jgi:hypothetical protein